MCHLANGRAMLLEGRACQMTNAWLQVPDDRLIVFKLILYLVKKSVFSDTDSTMYVNQCHCHQLSSEVLSLRFTGYFLTIQSASSYLTGVG